MFLTRAQSAGRGTRGRSFESPEGAGLYFSLLIYPSLHAKDAHLLTSAAAVAVCRALERESKGISPRIKWVNDVYLGERKLCCILTEGDCDDCGMLRYAVIGIGINVKRAALSPEVLAIATSLEDAGVTVEVTDLAARITKELLKLLSDTQEIADEYRARSMLIGREVEITAGRETKAERVVDIDPECALITEDEDKRIHRYISGDVKIHPIKKEDT